MTPDYGQFDIPVVSSQQIEHLVEMLQMFLKSPAVD
jgi:hypothetical protein